jgi:hypothetical protein
VLVRCVTAALACESIKVFAVHLTHLMFPDGSSSDAASAEGAPTVRSGGERGVDGSTFTKRDCFLQALRCDPKYTNAWLQLGLDLSETERVDVAGETFARTGCFRRAIFIEPTYAPAWSTLGVDMVCGGRVRAADAFVVV